MAAPAKAGHRTGRGGHKKTLRNWRDRFNPDATFVWRRVVKWAGERTEVGALVPTGLIENKKKLCNFFEGNYIEIVHADDVVAPATEEKPAAKKAVAKKPAAKKAVAKKPAAKKAVAKKPAAKKAVAKKPAAKKAVAKKPGKKQSQEARSKAKAEARSKACT